jgi:hypothetical protein
MSEHPMSPAGTGEPYPGALRGRAEAFWEGTRDHDVSQNIEALLRHIGPRRPSRSSISAAGRGATLLDFTRRGHRHRLEGARRWRKWRVTHSGCEVWEQDFLSLICPRPFSTASLPMPRCSMCRVRELPRVLRQIAREPQAGGVLFSSNPARRQPGERSTASATAPTMTSNLAEYLRGSGLSSNWSTTIVPPGLPREQQPWLASVWRKMLN